MATATSQTVPTAEPASSLSKKRKTKSFKKHLKRSIYCSNYPSSENTEHMLKEHFSVYGKVHNVRVMACFAFLEFSSQQVIPNVLKEEHIINGKRLKVELRNAPMEINSSAMFTDTLKLINQCETTSEQVETYVNQIALNHEDYEARAFVQFHIQELLKPFYSDSRIFAYGSTMNGFGVHGTDLDLLFVPSPGYFEETHLSENEDLPSSDQRNFEGSYETLVKYPRYNQLQFLLRVFRKSRAIIFPRLISAAVPIITFTFRHDNIKLQCDLSCSNMLSVYNSKLLNLFSKLDNRVKPFLIILKQWAKSSNIMKKGSMSTYAFQLIAIFFLQNANPPVLPTVEEMMSRSYESRIVEGYETAFEERVTEYLLSLNSKPVEILLKEFFVFYLKFDFFSYIISPRTGYPIDKRLLIDANNEYAVFKDSVLCVQDPFEVYRNLTSNFCSVEFENFLSACRYAQKQYAPNAVKSDDIPFGIISLIKLREEYLLPIKCNFFRPIEGALTSFSFCISPELVSIVEKLKHNWCDIFCAAILHIFNHALLFDANITDLKIVNYTTTTTSNDGCHDKVNDGCHDKVNDDYYDGVSDDCHNKVNDGSVENITKKNSGSDIHGNHPLLQEKFINKIVRIEAVILYDTYEARSNCQPSVVDDLSEQKPLDNDHELSRSMMISNGPLKEAKNFTCHVYCFRKQKRKKRYLGITLSSSIQCQYLPEYAALAAFLEKFMTAKLMELFSDDPAAFCQFLHNV